VTVVEMPAAQLQAYVDTLPKPDRRGFVSAPQPPCPHCSAEVARIDVVGSAANTLSYVAIKPCGHLIAAMYTLQEQP
jgi:anti-sigma factor RsiW